MAEFYKAKNLQGLDAKLLVELSSYNLDAVNKAIASIDVLKRNLEVYKECLIDSINLEAESADIATEYATEEVGQSYNLPGTISKPALTDIDKVKADSARMISIQSSRSKVASQADTYLSQCKSCVNSFFQAWKAMNTGILSWKDYIFNLNNSINKNY